MTAIERGLIALVVVPLVGLSWQALGGGSTHSVGDAWRWLAAEPALVQSLVLTFSVALASVVASLYFARWLCYQVVWKHRNQGLQLALLSVPHAALALGVLLLLGASGVLVRLLLSGSFVAEVPDYLFPKDPFGLGVLLVLVLKESVFLAVLAVPLALRLPVSQTVRVGCESGLSAWSSWCHLVWPRVVRWLSAPILVIFAFSLMNLEVTAVLGPDRPAFLSVRLLDWLSDPNPLIRQAGALAMLAVLVTLTAASLIYVRAVYHRVPGWHRVYKRRRAVLWALLWWFLGGVSVGGLISLLLWSGAGYWPVTESWPSFNGRGWDGLGAQSAVWWETLRLGLMVACSAIVLAVLSLEWMAKRRMQRLSWVWWGLLWMPALPLSAGLLATMGWIGLSPGWTAVWLGHLLIAWPYAVVVLADTWLSRPESARRVLAESGVNSVHALLRIWLPLHSPVIGLAFAVAFSVSASLYTQTLLLGGGRVETLMTELVISLHSDRRVASAAALVNAALPMALFFGVTFLGRRMWRHRLGMQGGARA